MEGQEETGHEIHASSANPCFQEAGHEDIKTTWSLAFPLILVLAFCCMNYEGSRNKMRRNQVTSSFFWENAYEWDIRHVELVSED
jgi:hypothetical protein